MTNQMKLNKDAQKDLEAYLQNLFSGDYKWKDFITKIETLEGNPEGYLGALNAKDAVKEVTGKLAKIAESMGIKEATDEKMKKLAEHVIKMLKEEDEEDTEDNTPVEDDDIIDNEVLDAASEEESSVLTSEDATELNMMVDELKMKIKSLEAQSAEKDKLIDELTDEMPEVIGSVVEAAIPEMIHIAKKQLLESNSDVRRKIDAYDKIAEIFNVADTSKELSEALSVQEFLRNFIKVREFKTSKRIQKMSESKKRIRKVNRRNIVALKERSKRPVNKVERAKILESIKQKLEAKRKAKLNENKEKQPVKKLRLTDAQRKKIMENIKLKSSKKNVDKRNKINEIIQRKKQLIKENKEKEGENKQGIKKEDDVRKSLKESAIRKMEQKKIKVNSDVDVESLQRDKNLRHLKQLLD